MLNDSMVSKSSAVGCFSKQPCTKERVAAYKYPRTVEFLDNLPKGATGKILKKELKQQLAAAGRL